MKSNPLLARPPRLPAPSKNGDGTHAAAPAEPAEKRFPLTDAATFLTGTYAQTWLVERVIVEGQPGTIAGPPKAVKTGIAIDLAVSAAAGVPFLGTFPVPRQVKTGILIGESGMGTTKETALRKANAAGISPADLGDWLYFGFDLPTVSDLASVAELADELAARGIKLLILDPLYLCLGTVDAKNLFEMGGALRVLRDLLAKRGITLILVHHANRQVQTGEPMELSHLAYSGLEQFVRQFILLNRRERYAGDGVHDLWLTTGGSAGHGGLWAVRIKEGVIDRDFGGRKWDVTVTTAADAHADRAGAAEAEQREKARRKVMSEEGAVLEAIRGEMANGRPGATRNRIKEETGMDPRKLNPIIEALAEAGAIEVVDFKIETGKGRTQPVTGFRIAENGIGGGGGATPNLPPPIGGGW